MSSPHQWPAEGVDRGSPSRAFARHCFGGGEAAEAIRSDDLAPQCEIRQICCFNTFDKENLWMRGLNLDQLRALVEVVERGSFSAAARELHLTQPAVSLQIRELERRFGVRLIERLGKQAHATVPGREL